MSEYKKNILCIGAGYVGVPSMAMIAYKCPDCRVTVADIDYSRINAWDSSALPIYEPGLNEIIQKTRNINLFFSTDIEKGIKTNDIIFVCVNTPTKNYGVGAGEATDLQFLEKVIRQIGKYSESSKIIIEKSTVPVKTCVFIEKILRSESKQHFDVLSNPEFMAEGTAINDLEFPSRVVIGSKDDASGINARNELVEIYSAWVPREKIITTNLWSSELSKLAANAFLAQRISSINAISALCERTGADVAEISRSIGMDDRIGGKFLNAGVGFGGSCFKKDILSLIYLCKCYGLDEVAAYWENVLSINEYQQKRFTGEIIKACNFLDGKKVCVFGCAFKADSDDIRESPALGIISQLLVERAHITISDPKALSNAAAHFGNAVTYEIDPYRAAKNSHAVIMLTDWSVFKELDYAEIYQSMKKPAYIFDGRNIIDCRKCKEIGFEVYSIGKG
jgi:UDPglucose 6-dehydrogenase